MTHLFGSVKHSVARFSLVALSVNLVLGSLVSGLPFSVATAIAAPALPSQCPGVIGNYTVIQATGVTQNGTNGKDFIWADDNNTTNINSGNGDDCILIGNNNEGNINGGNQNDTIIIGDDNEGDVNGGNQNDTIIIGDGNEGDVLGGANNDSIEVGDNNSGTLNGEANEDTIVAGDNNTGDLIGGSNNDNITGGSGTYTIDGGSNNDVCTHGSGSVTVINCETVIENIPTPTTGDIEITKYLCENGTETTRIGNGPTATGAHVVPAGCEEQSGAYFGYTYQSDREDNSSPYTGAPFTVMAATDVNGVTMLEDMPEVGRYNIVELNSNNGNDHTYSKSDLLGLYCYGDPGFLNGPEQFDNYEVTFIPTGGTTYCVAYNEAAYVAPVCEPEVNLVQNGSFEAPIITNVGLWDIVPTGTPGLEWTVEWINSHAQTPAVEFNRQYAGWPSADGMQHAELDGDLNGPSNPGTEGSVKIYQDIAVDTAEEYTLSFEFSPRPGINEANNTFGVYFDNVLIDTISANGLANSTTDWNTYTYTVQSSNATARLELRDMGPANSYGALVDDVKLTCGAEDPEPVEMDMGFETQETLDDNEDGNPAMGFCPVTTADQTDNGGNSSNQVLKWTEVPGAVAYRVTGYRLDGVNWVPYGSPYTKTLAQLTISGGVVSYDAYATAEVTTAYFIEALSATDEVLGSTSPETTGFSCTFTVDRTPVVVPDTTPPVIQIDGYRDQADGTYDNSQAIRPCGTVNTTGAVAFEWSEVGTDPSQPLSYLYEIIGGPHTGFSAPHSDTHHNGVIPTEGVHTIQVTATDAAGNVSEPVECVVTYDADYNEPVDETAPVIEMLGFRDQTSATYDNVPAIRACGSINTTGFIAFEWAEVGTDESQPLSYLYEIIGGPHTGYSAPHSDTHHNGVIPTEGVHLIRVTATDDAGNVSEPVECEMTYDSDYVEVVPECSIDADCNDGFSCSESQVCVEDDDGGDDSTLQGGEGVTAPQSNGNNGSWLGHRTNSISGAAKFLTGFLFGSTHGDVAPGAFGGGPNIPFSDDEIKLICSMRKALPVNLSSSMLDWLSDYLSPLLNRDADMISEALLDPSLCKKEVKKVSIAKPKNFKVDQAGYPISKNVTWNACINGTVTLQDIRNNTDKDDRGIGRDCSFYHTGSLWKHPDHGVYFTFVRKGKTMKLPAGFVVQKEQAVSQK